MKNIITISLATTTFLMQSVFAEDLEPRDRIHSVKKAVNSIGKMQIKEVSAANSVKHMFEDAKVSGELKTMYVGYNQKEVGVDNSYATAIGGILKYELAELNGFNAAVAVYTSHDVSSLTGDGTKHNSELSSSRGSYTQMSEAYLNYKYKDFNFRAGRQVLNTPLADSDDIRIIQNTFEAYVATYDYKAFELMAGHINSWQGYDAGLDDGWSKAGENGTNFGGVSYNNVLELNAWYYNITKETNAAYFDFGIQYGITKDMIFHAMAQYLKEDELSNSGYKTEIYGGMVEYVIHGLSFNIAYNQADSRNGKESFSGTGGGTLFTSMDTMILDEIAQDRKANAIVSGISYNYKDFNFLYAYGSFKGDRNSLGEKENIVEQDISFEYNVDAKFTLAALYAMQEDRQHSQKTAHDWNRSQLMLQYNF